MADRIQTIYANDALYVGPTPSTGHHYLSGASAGAVPNSGHRIMQLARVQSVSYGFGIDRANVNQFGEHAAIDRPILTPPMPTLQFTYLLANMWNEKHLGFGVTGKTSALTGVLRKTEDDKNYFLLTVPEGEDAAGHTDMMAAKTKCMSLGNGFVTSYSTEAAVGGFPTVTVNVEGLNMMFQTGYSGQIPAVHPDDGSRFNRTYGLPLPKSDPGTGYLALSVLRPGDIHFTILKRQAEGEGNVPGSATGNYDTVGVDIDTAYIQRYNLSFALNRDTISRLGNRYAVAREPVFPIPTTLSIDAIVSDVLTGSVFDIVNCDDAYDIGVTLWRPSGCNPGTASIAAVRYELKNAKLNSQNFSMDVGARKTVTFTFETQVGGPHQTGIGVFFSGLTTEA